MQRRSKAAEPGPEPRATRSAGEHGEDATAAAVNLERFAAWFGATPRAATRTSRFAALAA